MPGRRAADDSRAYRRASSFRRYFAAACCFDDYGRAAGRRFRLGCSYITREMMATSAIAAEGGLPRHALLI